MDALLSLKEFTSLGTHSILRCFVVLSVKLLFVTSVIFLFTSVKYTRFVQVASWTGEPFRVLSVLHDFPVKLAVIYQFLFGFTMILSSNH